MRKSPVLAELTLWAIPCVQKIRSSVSSAHGRYRTSRPDNSLEGVGWELEVRQVIGTGLFPGGRIRACRRSEPVGTMCGDLKSRSRSVTPVVQSRSSLVQCSNWARSKPVQTSGARRLGIPCRTTIPAGRSSEAHGTRRPRPNDGIRRLQAWQAQTLRFFLLRLLRPPPSSKPQRLLAATGPEPTLAADSVLGARHQLPDVVSMKGRLTHNHPRPPMRISTRTSATAPACTTTRIQHGSATTTILRSSNQAASMHRNKLSILPILAP
jgi:hypothetical protein